MYFFMPNEQRKKPLTIPQMIKTIDNVEWLTFVYTAKGVSIENTIRIDIDSVQEDEIDPTFKASNSIYPGANIDRESYKGNRWNYETSVNLIGWKLSWLNQDILVGKRGLLQRAVDRNKFPSMQSRRAARVKKQTAPKHLTPASSPKVKPPVGKTLMVETIKNQSIRQYSVNIDFGSIPPNVDSLFKVSFYVFPEPQNARQEKLNELAWKLAFLNPDVLQNSPTLLQKALDTYLLEHEPLEMWPFRRRRAGCIKNH